MLLKCKTSIKIFTKMTMLLFLENKWQVTLFRWSVFFLYKKIIFFIITKNEKCVKKIKDIKVQNLEVTFS